MAYQTYTDYRGTIPKEKWNEAWAWASGTFASGSIVEAEYLPYVGAIKNTDLGSYDLTTTGDVTKGKSITTGGKIENTTRITDTSMLVASNQVVFCDTDNSSIIVSLPAGVEGTNYKIINCGSSGNTVSVGPSGSERLYGDVAGASGILADGEVINIHYNTTEGWW